MISIFLTNLNKYNNGELVGEWIDLPCEDLQKRANKISNNGADELFITDYETELEIERNEYANIYELNEFAEKLDELDEWDYKTAKALIETGYYNNEQIFDKIDDCIFYEGMDFEDIAEEYIKDCYDIPEGLERYIDYSQFARDLEYSGEYIEVEDGILYLG